MWGWVRGAAPRVCNQNTLCARGAAPALVLPPAPLLAVNTFKEGERERDNQRGWPSCF